MKLKQLLTYGSCAFALLVLAAIFLNIDAARGSRAALDTSVEIGLAELSPRQAAGGYAVPASGDSNPGPVIPGVLTLVINPASASVGKDTEIRWKWDRASGLGLEHVTVTRCKTAGFSASECPNWVNIISLDGKKFGGGMRDFTCFIFLPCHEVIVKGTSPKYDAEASGLTPGSYAYKAVGKFTTGPITSTAVLTVNGTIADLEASSLGFASGSSIVDEVAVFGATVKNIGTASTKKAFSNKFEYRWGTSGAWVTLNTVSTPALAQGISVAVTSSSFTLKKSGKLQVRLCTDSSSVVTESDESNNCTEEVTYDMSSLFPGLTPISLDRTGTLKPGQTQTFTGLILNSGKSASSASTAHFCIDNDDCVLNTADTIASPGVPALQANEISPALNATWKATLGPHIAYFCAVGKACLALSFEVTNNPDETEVAQQPISLTALDREVRNGGTTNLMWNTGNSTCTLVGTNGLSVSNLTGTGLTSSGIMNQKSIFTLTCKFGGKTTTAEVTVNLIPVVREI